MSSSLLVEAGILQVYLAGLLRKPVMHSHDLHTGRFPEDTQKDLAKETETHHTHASNH